MDKLVLQKIPTSPGAYIYINNRKEVIYVGKAKNLKKRVSSYFVAKVHDAKTALLIKNISSIDFIATNNEIEALLLENRLIKKYKPKYNIHLKDSARYYYIHITDEKFPRVLIARKITNKGQFFGPYTVSMFDIVKLIRRLFNLRACSPGKYTRPCLYYQIGMCSGPCGNKISKEQYDQNVLETIKFLRSGGSQELRDGLENKMLDAAKEQDYEAALECRKKSHLLAQLKQRQIVDTENKQDQDAVAIATLGEKSCISILKLKKGVILHKEDFVFFSSKDLLDEFLKVFYTKNPAPSEILVGDNFDSTLEEYFYNLWQKKVKILKPSKGKKLDLVNLTLKNAYLQFNLEDPVLIEMKDAIRLDVLPQVVDVFDISNYGSSVVVGACVQYKNKQPNKGFWRLYNIKGDFGQDDFRSINEVVKRRYSSLDLPDLIIIDGGQIQVDFALRALKELGKTCHIVGLAKKEERIVFPEGDSLKLNKRLDSSKLIMRMRDSAHNFAIGHSRSVFKSKYKKSELDNIFGIGDKTKFLLLREFSSLQGIKKASLDEIIKVLGPNKGHKIYENLNK